jgi:hypothetical protein
MPARIRPPSQAVDGTATSSKQRQALNATKEDDVSSASGDKPLEGQPFTADDDKVLDKEYEDIINIDPALTIAAWERFADNVCDSEIYFDNFRNHAEFFFSTINIRPKNGLSIFTGSIL